MTPVVFLHGFLGGPDEWSQCLQALKHPHADAIALPTATGWQQGIRALLALLPSKSILIGYSMGARVAMGAAFAQPSRFAAVGFIAGNPGLDDRDREARAASDDRLAQQMATQSTQQFLQAWYSQPLFQASDASLRVRWIRERASLDRSYQRKLLRCYSIAHQPDYWPQLPFLPIPMLAVVGRRDLKYRAIGERLKSCVPTLRYHEIPDVGHAPHRESPSDLAHVIDDFLATLRSEEPAE